MGCIWGVEWKNQCNFLIWFDLIWNCGKTSLSDSQVNLWTALQVAHQFSLQVNKDVHQLRGFTVPHAFLPLSFHQEVMKHSAKWLDVYQERGNHTQEAARVRLMDMVLCDERYMQLNILHLSGMFPFALCLKVVLIALNIPCLQCQKCLVAVLSTKCSWLRGLFW